jgi:heat shock protein HtpX
VSGRGDLFPPDRGLQLRMALALTVNGVLVVAAVGVLVWVTLSVHDGWSLVFVVVCFAVIGAAAVGRKRRSGRGVRPSDRQRLADAVSRVAALADVRSPDANVERDSVPLSWTYNTPWQRPRVYVTTALLDQVSGEELEAVVAHEITHIANHDALVMTLLSAPSTWILRGCRRMWEKRHESWKNVAAIVCFGWYCVPVASVLALMMYVVSRHRELAADRGAAVLTGSPARVAAVLTRLADDIGAMPTRDLRLAVGADAFHLLPARKTETQGIARLWATHPRLRTRLSQLERMEHELQSRPALGRV